MRRVIFKATTKERKSLVMRKPSLVLTYRMGETVLAKPGTCGIFCFLTKRKAKRFAKCWHNDGMVLRVRPIGRKMKLPKNLFHPKETVCYPGVEVLS